MEIEKRNGNRELPNSSAETRQDPEAVAASRKEFDRKI